ncbi:hypothetical protein ACP70R_008726 [Stipagrostis hirtigluma subsp. patula]
MAFFDILPEVPERLWQISERIYVFDCCFSTDSMGEYEYRDYFDCIVKQLKDCYPGASFLVSNFRSGDERSLASDILSGYGMSVMQYSQQYKGCPLLSLQMIQDFLESSKSQRSLHQHYNVLLIHCERGVWPVLAFMLAGLLVYEGIYAGVQTPLDMVYKKARTDLVRQFCPLNPKPSHLRYLHYITRHRNFSEWPPLSRPLILDSVILWVVPKFDAEGGCRPYLHVHGQDPSTGNKSAKVLSKMPKTTKQLQRYGQAEVPVKVGAFCRVQGDVVLECIHIGDDLEHKEVMFRVMFNTAFIQSNNTLTLSRDDIDVHWNANSKFPRDFRAEVLFLDTDSLEPAATAVEVEIADARDQIDVVSLEEIVGARVDLVAEKMKVMPNELLEEIKSELRLTVEGYVPFGGGRHGLRYLQKLVQGRDDLTPATLSMAHRVQLEVLVAIKTGIHTFMDPRVDIPESYLTEVLLDKRCRNIDCRNALPAGECQCNICASMKGFCHSCTCMICKKFDFESNTCRWIGCKVCSHWTHTECAISRKQIRTENGTGHARMIYQCQSCQLSSELLGSIRDVFMQGAPGWSRDDLSRELDYLCNILGVGEESKWRTFIKMFHGLRRSKIDQSVITTMVLQTIQDMVDQEKNKKHTQGTSYFAEMSDKENEREALERILISASAPPVELSYALLENITNNFSNVIGCGGFGKVYKGDIGNKEVAVKKLFQIGLYSDGPFMDELTCLRRVKHKNIVRFLGHCFGSKKEPIEHQGKIVMAEIQHRFLCFEYVPNKSLRDYLKGKSYGHKWDTSYQLIEGICQGLGYLHIEEKIIHLDLKPENILLDFDMVPKIADFGISRRFSGEQSGITTKNVRGSRRYIAPEYWSKGKISFKLQWHQSVDIDNPHVKRCIEMAELCVHDDPRKRPTIDCIIDMLSKKETTG